MNPYAAAFVMFLYQLSVGGLVGLSVTPFTELERGFYKSTTGVLVVAAVLALWGQFDLLPQVTGSGRGPEGRSSGRVYPLPESFTSSLSGASARSCAPVSSPPPS